MLHQTTQPATSQPGPGGDGGAEYGSRGDGDISGDPAAKIKDGWHPTIKHEKNPFCPKNTNIENAFLHWSVQETEWPV